MDGFYEKDGETNDEAPEARLIIARRFNAGKAAEKQKASRRDA
jgi:hypothetical protein